MNNELKSQIKEWVSLWEDEEEHDLDLTVLLKDNAYFIFKRLLEE